jgi:uncharacterized protein YfaT (DUF1175 family)
MGLALSGTGRFMRQVRRPSPRVVIRPDRLLADGYDSATITIENGGATRPRLVVDNAHAAVVHDLSGGNGNWTAKLRARVLPGAVRVRVEAQDAAPVSVEVSLLPDARDSFSDGTPDALRLDRESDRRAFRRWFTYLAEAQYFQPAASRPPEIADCAALIRYAYRETLRAHENGWAEAANVPVVPAFEPVAKYQYPYTLLGTALFRTAPPDSTDGAFAQFADAKTLCRFNTHRVGRDLARAMPGDLLFFRQPDARMAHHSMIYMGESQVRPDGARYVVYHTGPDDGRPGEMRRLRLEDLLRFPEPEWRPLAENPNFLGVFRWNILRQETDADAPAPQ